MRSLRAQIRPSGRNPKSKNISNIKHLQGPSRRDQGLRDNAGALDITQLFQFRRDSHSLGSDSPDQNSRNPRNDLAATIACISTKKIIFAIDLGDCAVRGCGLVKKSLFHEANARTRARGKRSSTLISFDECAAGKFAIDVPPPPALQKGGANRFALARLVARLHARALVQKLAKRGIVVRRRERSIR